MNRFLILLAQNIRKYTFFEIFILFSKKLIFLKKKIVTTTLYIAKTVLDLPLNIFSKNFKTVHNRVPKFPDFP